MSPVAVCTLVRLSVSRSVQSRSHILRLTHHGVASTLTSENLKWRTAAILKIKKSHLPSWCHIKVSPLIILLAMHAFRLFYDLLTFSTIFNDCKPFFSREHRDFFDNFTALIKVRNKYSRRSAEFEVRSWVIPSGYFSFPIV